MGGGVEFWGSWRVAGHFIQKITQLYKYSIFKVFKPVTFLLDGVAIQFNSFDMLSRVKWRERPLTWTDTETLSHCIKLQTAPEYWKRKLGFQPKGQTPLSKVLKKRSSWCPPLDLIAREERAHCLQGCILSTPEPSGARILVPPTYDLETT